MSKYRNKYTKKEIAEMQKEQNEELYGMSEYEQAIYFEEKEEEEIEELLKE